jgi:type IV pilus assembly protein PilW
MKRQTWDSERQSGFSLLEIMVATLLGTILAAGIVSVYTTSRRDYARNSALESVQTSARLSLSVLDQKIRMAGFFGCGHGMQPVSSMQTKLAAYDVGVPIQGYEYSGTGMGDAYPSKPDTRDAGPDAADWSPALPPDISRAVGLGAVGPGASAPGAAVPGNDILLLHEAAPGEVELVAPSTDGADGLHVAPDQVGQLAAGNLAVVSDCTQSELFQITGISGNEDGDHDRVDDASGGTPSSGNFAPARFAHEHTAGSRIFLYQTYLFYIGRDQKGAPALYQISMGPDATLGRPAELASGVESMQFLYGLDTDGDEIPNQYLTADQVTDWARVVCVRVALLTRSGGSYAGTAGDASFKLLDTGGGLNFKVPADGHIRKVFEETISIRNRLP